MTVKNYLSAKLKNENYDPQKFIDLLLQRAELDGKQGYNWIIKRKYPKPTSTVFKLPDGTEFFRTLASAKSVIKQYYKDRNVLLHNWSESTK